MSESIGSYTDPETGILIICVFVQWNCGRLSIVFQSS